MPVRRRQRKTCRPSSRLRLSSSTAKHESHRYRQSECKQKDVVIEEAITRFGERPLLPSLCAPRHPRKPAWHFRVCSRFFSLHDLFVAFLTAGRSSVEQLMLAAAVSLSSPLQPVPSQRRMAPSLQPWPLARHTHLPASMNNARSTWLTLLVRLRTPAALCAEGQCAYLPCRLSTRARTDTHLQLRSTRTR